MGPERVADAAPPFPAEVGVDGRCDVIDEFGDVFMPQARTRGIEPLPAPLRLVASDAGRRWWITRDWQRDGCPRSLPLPHHPLPRHPSPLPPADLALMIWERADPFDSPDRFALDGDAEVCCVPATQVHI